MSRIKVMFPAVLSTVTNGERAVELDAVSLTELLDKLSERYGGKFANRIFESPGKLRRLLNFYVNGKNIHYLQGVNTVLNDGDEVSILPAVSGG